MLNFLKGIFMIRTFLASLLVCSALTTSAFSADKGDDSGDDLTRLLRNGRIVVIFTPGNGAHNSNVGLCCLQRELASLNATARDMNRNLKEIVLLMSGRGAAGAAGAYSCWGGVFGDDDDVSAGDVGEVLERIKEAEVKAAETVAELAVGAGLAVEPNILDEELARAFGPNPEATNLLSASVIAAKDDAQGSGSSSGYKPDSDNDGDTSPSTAVAAPMPAPLDTARRGGVVGLADLPNSVPTNPASSPRSNATIAESDNETDDGDESDDDSTNAVRENA